jgi:hypothetical protein
MKTYRIFSRDRGRKYSCLMGADAESARAALKQAPPNLQRIPGMLKAIEWNGPHTQDGAATPAGRAWLHKNL